MHPNNIKYLMLEFHLPDISLKAIALVLYQECPTRGVSNVAFLGLPPLELPLSIFIQD
jgi:hypothetical protein